MRLFAPKTIIHYFSIVYVNYIVSIIDAQFQHNHTFLSECLFFHNQCSFNVYFLCFIVNSFLFSPSKFPLTQIIYFMYSLTTLHRNNALQTFSSPIFFLNKIKCFIHVRKSHAHKVLHEKILNKGRERRIEKEEIILYSCIWKSVSKNETAWGIKLEECSSSYIIHPSGSERNKNVLRVRAITFHEYEERRREIFIRKTCMMEWEEIKFATPLRFIFGCVLIFICKKNILLIE